MTVLLILAIVVGFYVAWNIGANDVANAVGPAVGSRSLTLKQAVIVAAIFEFCGAFFLGSNVSETLEGGIVNPALFDVDNVDYLYGMLGALMATGIWLQTATLLGWPVSTTHTIVGGVLGFGLVYGGYEAIYWSTIGSIAVSWIISPLLGGAVAYFIFSIIRRKILYHPNPLKAAIRLTPYFVFAIFSILSTIILFGGLSSLNFHLNIFLLLLIVLSIGGAASLTSIFLLKRIKNLQPIDDTDFQVEWGLKKVQKHLERVEAVSLGDVQTRAHDLLDETKALMGCVSSSEERRASHYPLVERMFAYLLAIIACFMAFAHGSNDVANVIGPLSAIVNGIQGNPLFGETVSIWLLLLGGIGIVVGLSTFGWRVIETVGKKITTLTPSRGFAAGFGAAITIMLASKLGLPISTTHVLVGAVLGVGFARGIGALNLSTIRDIFISWIVTVPAGATLSILFFLALKAIFS
ncbi:MAG: inorganic phosphate transporter [Chlamydiales bacterium]